MAISEKDMHYLRKYTDRELNEYEKSLDDLESKGKNIQDYRDALAIVRSERTPEARAAATAAREANIPQLNLSKLDPYKKGPLDINSQFFKDTVGVSPIWVMFNKRKWLEKQTNANVIYMSIVQANEVLWSSKGENGFAVFLYTTDPTYQCDKDWLRAVTEKLTTARDSANVPADCKELVAKLRDPDSSIYDVRVPNSLTNGVEVFCTVMFVMTGDLLNKRLPPDGILPKLLVKENNNKNIFKDIPIKYYS